MLVDVVSFGVFCSGLIQMRTDLLLYGALVESLRTGIRGPIPFDPDMTQWKDAHFEYDWGGANLATLYSYMSSISCQKVDWHPWAGIPQALKMTYVAVWHASTMRILFEDPFGRAYYLGERFIR
ncbi:hypothetical protein CsSME_00023000 [Camellia sinensis var. sinensis]